MSLGLVLQFQPAELEAVYELATLLADCEEAPRRTQEFILFGRKDVPPEEMARIRGALLGKFPKAIAIEPWDFATGWPHGPNTMWCSLMRQLYDLARNGQTKASGFLTFEPDCIPCARDWLSRLETAWELALRDGVEVLGHMHPNKEAPTHINGNAIFVTDFWKRHEEVTGCHGMMSWDTEFARTILPVGRDTPLISQWYRMPDFNLYQWKQIIKSGCVFFHGVKTPMGRAIARRQLLGTRVRARIAVPKPKPAKTAKPKAKTHARIRPTAHRRG